MKKIMLAIGHLSFEKNIQLHLPEYAFTERAAYKEEVISKVESEKPDIIIIRETLQGSLSSLQILREIKLISRSARVIFISKKRDYGDLVINEVINLGIYDIINSESVDLKYVVNLVKNPNSYADVDRFRFKKKIEEETAPSIKEVEEKAPQTSLLGGLKSIVKQKEKALRVAPVLEEEEVEVVDTSQPKKNSLFLTKFKKNKKVDTEEKIIEEDLSQKSGIIFDIKETKKEEIEEIKPEEIVREKRIEEPERREEKPEEKVIEEKEEEIPQEEAVSVEPVSVSNDSELKELEEKNEVKPNGGDLDDKKLTAAKNRNYGLSGIINIKKNESESEDTSKSFKMPKEKGFFISKFKSAKDEDTLEKFTYEVDEEEVVNHRIITFCNTTGGTGTSTLAFNTFLALGLKYSVVYVDLNSQFSSSVYFYDLPVSEKTLYSALLGIEEGNNRRVLRNVIDRDDLLDKVTEETNEAQSIYYKFPGNCHFLINDPSQEKDSKITPDSYKDLILHLVSNLNYDYVIIDSGNNLYEKNIGKILDISSLILPVARQDLESFGAFDFYLEHLSKKEGISINRDKIHYVLNRYSSEGIMDIEEIKDVVETDNIMHFPEVRDMGRLVYEFKIPLFDTKEKSFQDGIKDIIEKIVYREE